MESSTEKQLEDFATQVDVRFDSVDQRITTFEYKVGLRFDSIDERFDRMDERFNLVDQRLSDLGTHLKKVDDLADAQRAFQQSVSQSLIAIASVMVAGFAAISAAIAFGI